MGKRREFTLEDDNKMYRFMYNRLRTGDSRARFPCGNQLWEAAEARKLTSHSIQSMRDRTRRILLSPDYLSEAAVPDNIRDYLARRYQIKIKQPHEPNHNDKDKTQTSNSDLSTSAAVAQQTTNEIVHTEAEPSPSFTTPLSSPPPSESKKHKKGASDWLSTRREQRKQQDSAVSVGGPETNNGDSVSVLGQLVGVIEDDHAQSTQHKQKRHHTRTKDHTHNDENVSSAKRVRVTPSTPTTTTEPEPEVVVCENKQPKQPIIIQSLNGSHLVQKSSGSLSEGTFVDADTRQRAADCETFAKLVHKIVSKRRVPCETEEDIHLKSLKSSRGRILVCVPPPSLMSAERCVVVQCSFAQPKHWQRLQVQSAHDNHINKACPSALVIPSQVSNRTMYVAEPVDHSDDSDTEYDYALAAVDTRTGHATFTPARLYVTRALHTDSPENPLQPLKDEREGRVDVDFVDSMKETRGESKRSLAVQFGGHKRAKLVGDAEKRFIKQDTVQALVDTTLVKVDEMSGGLKLESQDGVPAIQLMLNKQNTDLLPSYNQSAVAPADIWDMKTLVPDFEQPAWVEVVRDVGRRNTTSLLAAGYKPVLVKYILLCAAFAEPKRSVRLALAVYLHTMLLTMQNVIKGRNLSAVSQNELDLLEQPVCCTAQWVLVFTGGRTARSNQRYSMDSVNYVWSAQQRDKLVAHILLSALLLSADLSLDVEEWTRLLDLPEMRVVKLLKYIGCDVSTAKATQRKTANLVRRPDQAAQKAGGAARARNRRSM